MKKIFPYNIRKSLTRILPFGLLMMLACHKDPTPIPTPEPDIPIDTTIARDTIIIDWNWQNSIGWAPPKYMIQEQINKPNVRIVCIKLTSPTSYGYTPYNFHNARDTLQTRLDIAPGRIRGKGTVYIDPSPGADSMPNHDMGQAPGIAWYDKLWFEQNGWKIEPVVLSCSK